MLVDIHKNMSQVTHVSSTRVQLIVPGKQYKYQYIVRVSTKSVQLIVPGEQYKCSVHCIR
jgi:hypothetical protein